MHLRTKEEDELRNEEEIETPEVDYYLQDHEEKEDSNESNNLVSVFIWQQTQQSKINVTDEGVAIRTKSFGHAALKTYIGGDEGKGFYISFWPGGCKSKSCKSQVPHLHDKDTDDLVEGFSPIRIDLTSLDVEAINNEFIKFIRNNYVWHPLGSSFYRSFIGIKGLNNCSGLVSDLLISGGINKHFKLKDEILPAILLGAMLGFVVGVLRSKIALAYMREMIEYAKIDSNAINLVVNIILKDPNGYRPEIAILTRCLLTTAYTILARIFIRKLEWSPNKSIGFIIILGACLENCGRSLLLTPLDSNSNLYLNFFKAACNEALNQVSLIALSSLWIYLAMCISKQHHPRNFNISFLQELILKGFFLPIQTRIFIGILVFPFSRKERFELSALLIDLAGLFLATSLVPRVLCFSSIATTPEHVKKLAESALIAEQEKKLKISNKNWISLTYEKFKKHPNVVAVGIAGVALSTLGFFAIRNNQYATTLCNEVVKNTVHFLKK